VPELYELKPPSLIEIASQVKSQGVELFFQHRSRHAFFKFQKAIQYLVLINKEEQCSAEILAKKKKLQDTLYCNMAGIHVQQGNWEAAIDLCTIVLKNNPNYVKALFRRGKSLMEIQVRMNGLNVLTLTLLDSIRQSTF